MTIEKPILKLNRQTGHYEGTFTLSVDAEIFRRMLFQYAEKEHIDPTDPDAWQRAIQAVAKVQQWLNHPHATITVQDTPVVGISQPEKVVTRVTKQKPRESSLEERICELARTLPPHLWEERCVTPTLDASHLEKERDAVGRLRYRERLVLKQVREEWQRGHFPLTPEAEEQERTWQAQQSLHLTTKIDAVATAVNGNRFR